MDGRAVRAPEARASAEGEPRAPYTARRILLGVTGGIAAYKSAWLARLLTLAGAEVDIVMTRAATEFIGAITFEALTGRQVRTGLLEQGTALDHISLAREAHAIVIAPATADFLARAVHGHADDLLTACLLAAGDPRTESRPVLIVPAMNDRMWAHPQTIANVERARALGYTILEPEHGPLASGEGVGAGRMPGPETIFAHVGRLLERGGSLRGKRVLVTAGPTREAVDPVRFLSNRSSGRMGVAMAESAWRRGAAVTLIAGPLDVSTPPDVDTIAVETTAEMAAAVQRELPAADVLVMAAAPADFRPASPAREKIKKERGARAISLERTPDILAATMGARRAGAVIVGFALETTDAVENGRGKLESKQLDMVVVNDATEPGAGPGGETNRVTLLRRKGHAVELPLMSKRAVAEAILDAIEELLDGR